MATASAPSPQPVRATLGVDGAAYELSTTNDLVGLRLYDVTGDDALVHMTPEQVHQLRADLAATLQQLAPKDTPPGIRSEAGRRVLEDLRRVFMALVEHDKLSGTEVDELARMVVQHVRSWRPYVLRDAVTP